MSLERALFFPFIGHGNELKITGNLLWYRPSSIFYKENERILEAMHASENACFCVFFEGAHSRSFRTVLSLSHALYPLGRHKRYLRLEVALILSHNVWPSFRSYRSTRRIFFKYVGVVAAFFADTAPSWQLVEGGLPLAIAPRCRRLFAHVDVVCPTHSSTRRFWGRACLVRLT